MMEPLSLPELTTPRLHLRGLRPSDWEVISHLRSDPEVNKYLNRPMDGTKEKALQFVAKILGLVKHQESYYWAITKESKMIGTVCLWGFSKDRKAAEVGFELLPEYQGQGLMSEALKVVLDFGFQKLQLQLIEGYTDPENKASIRLLQRNGFVPFSGETDQSKTHNKIYRTNR